jgi:hypothetical protein
LSGQEQFFTYSGGHKGAFLLFDRSTRNTTDGASNYIISLIGEAKKQYTPKNTPKRFCVTLISFHPVLSYIKNRQINILVIQQIVMVILGSVARV